MAKTRVFVSFDFDNDKVLKELIVGQFKNPDSPFEVLDTSLKEAAPERAWLERAESKIKGSDMVIVMVGPKTSKASGVLKEVALARKLGIRVVQVIGYRAGDHEAVPNAGESYRWNWKNLKKLVN